MSEIFGFGQLVWGTPLEAFVHICIRLCLSTAFNAQRNAENQIPMDSTTGFHTYPHSMLWSAIRLYFRFRGYCGEKLLVHELAGLVRKLFRCVHKRTIMFSLAHSGEK